MGGRLEGVECEGWWWGGMEGHKGGEVVRRTDNTVTRRFGEGVAGGW